MWKIFKILNIIYAFLGVLFIYYLDEKYKMEVKKIYEYKIKFYKLMSKGILSDIFLLFYLYTKSLKKDKRLIIKLLYLYYFIIPYLWLLIVFIMISYK